MIEEFYGIVPINGWCAKNKTPAGRGFATISK